MSSSSRKSILSKLRQHQRPKVELPNLSEGHWIQYDDPVAQLQKTLEFVGGSFHQVENVGAIENVLANFEEWRAARRVLSLVDEVTGNVCSDEVATPHEFEDLDFVVARGDLAVAENAAVWVDDRQVRHRVCYFITQYLILVVNRDSLVSNMYEAYQRLGQPFPRFGCFISGPSKTADIEQSLVIGAHGCRSMQLFLVG